MKYRFLFLIVFLPLLATSQQVDTAYLKALYDRCLDFDESKADSVDLYAGFISTEAARLKFIKGDVLSSRLKGIAEDLKGNYDKAIVYYFHSLEAARKLHAINYEVAALNDLAYIYVNTKQLFKARDMYLECARLSEQQNIHSLITSYINLGGIYNEIKEPDSALVFLNKGLEIANKHNDKANISSLNNNIGNVYFQKKEYMKALGYFQTNYRNHVTGDSRSDLWYDNLNLADVFIELKQFDSAGFHASMALHLAEQMDSRSKEADSYSIFSKLYFHKKEYKNAYDYQQKWYTVDTGLVNENTNKAIAGLQEKFNAKEREQENKLLQVAIDRALLRSRTITYLAIAAILIALLIAGSLIKIRIVNKRLKEQNDLIRRQNEKLAELNYEKNSLISIVSHDLASPFAAIKMWSQVLQSETNNLTAEQQKAIERVYQSATRGESLIRTILDVEKAETNQHRMLLENFDLKIFVENLVDDFKASASGKNISLHFETDDKHIYLVSDKHLVSRICENLFSNAIKYTPPGKNVWVSLSDANDAVSIKVKDEGVGIDKTEMPHLFSKYSQLSSKPTDGEASTGLGLSIVKRIVQELNGSVFCESEPGKGSLFTVVLKK